MPTLVWRGVGEFDRALQRLVADASRAAQRGANAAALAVATRTKEKLTTTTHRRGEPTPSRPGEPPSLVTGTLRRSIKVIPAEPRGATGWASKVGPTAVYGRIQELGGPLPRSVHRAMYKHDPKLPARPYLGPAVQELIDSGALWTAFRSGWDRF